LTVVEDVAAANDHGALLVEQVDKHHDKQQDPDHDNSSPWSHTPGSIAGVDAALWLHQPSQG
jgi:hypothetical protein